MAEEEQHRPKVIEAILKTDGVIIATKIAEACKVPPNYVGPTFMNGMPCVFIDGRGTGRGSKNGPILYKVDWKAIYPDPDTEETSCCDGCTNAEEFCKREWRIPPVDGSTSNEED